MSENESYPQDRGAEEQRYQEYQPSQTQPYPQAPAEQQYAGQYPNQYPQPAAPLPYTTVRDHPQAVMAFVLGLLSVLGLAILGPFGWYFGRKVVREIDAAPAGSYTNRGLGMAGMVLGIIGTVMMILIIAFVIIAIVALAIAGSNASTA